MKENNNGPVVVLGSGGHSQVLISSLKSQGRKILGIVGPALGGQKNFLNISVIDDNCHIGTCSVILNNIVINKNSIIAMDSTVFEDQPPNTKLIQRK